MKKRLEEKIEGLQSENLELERQSEKLKSTLRDTRDKIQANTRAMEILVEVLEETPEEGVLLTPVVSKKREKPRRKASLKAIIMDYARTHSNEELHSDHIEEHVARLWGRLPGKGTLSTYLGILVKAGLLKRTAGQKRFICEMPGEVSKKEEVPFTSIDAKVNPATLVYDKAATKKVIFEIMRSHANEAMKTKQIGEAIKQKYPALHISRDVIWFHLNKTLGPMGLVKKVSLGSYQYEFPKKEIREDDCFAIGGD